MRHFLLIISLFSISYLTTTLTNPSDAFAEEESGGVVTSPGDLTCGATLPPEDQANSSILTVVGVRCFKEKKYLMALNYYRQAYKLSTSPFLLGAMGRVFEEMRLTSLAAAYYRRFLQRAYDMDGRIGKRLKNLDTMLKEKGVKFTLDSSPSGADAYILMKGRHEEPIGRTPIAMELIPGSYEIIFRRMKYQEKKETIDIPEDVSDSEVVVRLYSESSLRLNTSNETWDNASIILYLTSTPIFVAGMTLAIVGHVKGKDAEKLFGFAKNDELEKVSNYKIAGYSLLGVGLAGLLTATTFQILSWDFSKQDGKKSGSVAAFLSPTGVAVSGTF